MASLGLTIGEKGFSDWSKYHYTSTELILSHRSFINVVHNSEKVQTRPGDRRLELKLIEFEDAEWV